MNFLGDVLGLAHKEIVVSTVGDPRLFDAIRTNGVHPAVALSLHTTDDMKRRELLPKAPKIPAADLLAMTPVQALTMFVSVVLVAPVTEEFAFRSVTTAVMRRWGDWPAVIFSALIFGMAHYSIQSLPVVLMAGFVMALLYVRTRNIWVNIFVHMLNNLLATLPIALEGLVGADAANIASNLLTYIVYGLGLIALVVLLIRNFTGHKVFRTPMQRGVPVRGKALWMFVNPGFICYYVLFVVMCIVTLYS